MLIVPESLREELRKPLGSLMSIDEFVQKYQASRIIAVGDIVVLSLLERGIRPFLSVYDLRSRRRELDGESRKQLEEEYPTPRRVRNPAGTITDELFSVAKRAGKEGGALLIEGEEDMATLVFMAECDEGVIIYGQPDQGVVAVECKEESKKRARELMEKMEKK